MKYLTGLFLFLFQTQAHSGIKNLESWEYSIKDTKKEAKESYESSDFHPSTPLYLSTPHSNVVTTIHNVSFAKKTILYGAWSLSQGTWTLLLSSYNDYDYNYPVVSLGILVYSNLHMTAISLTTTGLWGAGAGFVSEIGSLEGMKESLRVGAHSAFINALMHFQNGFQLPTIDA